jgi:outer membrane protein TolC
MMRPWLVAMTFVVGSPAPAPPARVSADLPGPQQLSEHIVEGRLRLTVDDAIRLALLNNTEVRAARVDYEASRYGIERVRGAFDPELTSSFRSTQRRSATTSQLEGALTRSDRNHDAVLGLAQALPTGTQYSLTFNGGRQATNDSFSILNPSYSSTLSLQLTQHLWGDRGPLVGRARIRQATEAEAQARADFETLLAGSIVAAVDRYWAAVAGRESLAVVRKSLDLAEQSYQRDKRALELGALPPLDIYQSESEVATRRLDVIQAQFALKRAEDELRQTIGADLDAQARAMPFDLVEEATPRGDLLRPDFEDALAQALARRPDLVALQHQLASDDTSIRLARTARQPDLSLQGFYTTRGLGGTQLDPDTTPPTVLTRGGLRDALSQLRSLDFPTYGFNVQLGFRLRNRGADADLGSAQAARQRTLYRMRQREQEIALDVRTAIDAVEESKLSMEASRLARDLAQKNLKAEERKYELGERTLFLVLQAQTRLAGAERSLVGAEIAYQRAIVALARATGTLLERYGGALGPGGPGS